MRLRCLCLKSPRRWNTRTTASATSKISPAGRNSNSSLAEVAEDGGAPARGHAEARCRPPLSPRTRALEAEVVDGGEGVVLGGAALEGDLELAGQARS